MTRGGEKAQRVIAERIITCSECRRQRWAPQVAEAIYGWRLLLNGLWICPECAAKKEGKR